MREFVINPQGKKKKNQPGTERKKEQQKFGSYKVNELVVTD